MPWTPVNNLPTYADVTGIEVSDDDAPPAVLVDENGGPIVLALVIADAWDVVPPTIRQAP